MLFKYTMFWYDCAGIIHWNSRNSFFFASYSYIQLQ
jgi:hypothetical protein